MLRIERQMILEPQNDVGDEEAYGAEGQHGDGVSKPALLALWIHSADAIGQSLYRLHQAVEQSSPSGIEHLKQIHPERFRDHQERSQIKHKLKPGVRVVHEE